VIRRPVIRRPVIRRPVIRRPVIRRPVIRRPVIDQTIWRDGIVLNHIRISGSGCRQTSGLTPPNSGESGYRTAARQDSKMLQPLSLCLPVTVATRLPLNCLAR
jgi:hypothetical protein